MITVTPLKVQYSYIKAGRRKDMDQENVVLCASSAYEKKFWFNDAFKMLPQHIKKELKIMCVLFTEDVGGILSMEFDSKGKLIFRVEADEGDLLYDEIGSVLKIKQLQREKRQLLEQLELFYRVFFLEMDAADEPVDDSEEESDE